MRKTRERGQKKEEQDVKRERRLFNDEGRKTEAWNVVLLMSATLCGSGFAVSYLYCYVLIVSFLPKSRQGSQREWSQSRLCANRWWGTQSLCSGYRGIQTHGHITNGCRRPSNLRLRGVERKGSINSILDPFKYSLCACSSTDISVGVPIVSGWGGEPRFEYSPKIDDHRPSGDHYAESESDSSANS